MKNYSIKTQVQNNKMHLNILKNPIYGLYPFYKKKKISVLIPHCNIIYNKDLNSVMSILNSLLNQTLKDTEIIISLKDININLISKIKLKYINNKNLKILKAKDNLFKDTINLIFLSESKFITVVKHNLLFNNSKFLEAIYNETLGKENNIYEFNIGEKIVYLIKNNK